MELRARNNRRKGLTGTGDEEVTLFQRRPNQMVIPLEIDDAIEQTAMRTFRRYNVGPGRVTKVKNYIQNNPKKVLTRGGIAMAGAGALAAGLSHAISAGGEKLADVVNQERFKEDFPEMPIVRNRLMERLAQDAPEHVTQADVTANAQKMRENLAYKTAYQNQLQESIKQQQAELENTTETNRRAAEKEQAEAAMKRVNEGHEGWFKNYPHVGPGNKILPEATNPIDNIAREHDIAYGKAKTKEDIYKADQEFLNKMSEIDSKSWSDTGVKSIAKLGIKGKTVIEQTLGRVIYPSKVNTTERKYYLIR